MAEVQLTKDGKHFFPFDADYLDVCIADGWRQLLPELGSNLPGLCDLVQKIATPDLTAAATPDVLVVGAVASEIAPAAQ